MSDETQSNALGLEFAQSPSLEEGDPSTVAVPASPATGTAEMARRRDMPYNNPDRYKTGGERVCQVFVLPLFTCLILFSLIRKK